MSAATSSRIALLSWPGLGCLAFLLALAAWLGHEGVALVLGPVLAIGLVARLWASLALRALVATRHLARDRAFPGERIPLGLALDNRKPLPLAWVRLEDRLPAALRPAEDGELGFATPLGAYESAQITRELLCRRRGCYRLGPLRALSGDPFGLIQAERRETATARLIVYPRLIALDTPALAARHPLGDGRDPARLFDDPTRTAGLRPYTTDTPSRQIAWKASARQGTLLARRLEPTVTRHAALLLAIDSFAADEEELLETAISATASLALELLARREPTGLFANAILAEGGGPIELPPGRGPDRRTLILEALARIEPGTSGPLADFLDRILQRLPHGTTLLVLAARIEPAALARLALLRRRGHAVQGLIVGPGALPGGAVAWRRLEPARAGAARPVPA